MAKQERAELKEIGEIIKGITPEEEQCILISQNGPSLCPFCRSKGAENDEDHLQFLYNRIKARNDRDYTRALIHLGSRYKNGQKGLPQDIVKAEDRNINKRTILMTLTQLCVLLICIAITILIRRKRR